MGIGIDTPMNAPQTNAYDVYHVQQGSSPWQPYGDNADDIYVRHSIGFRLTLSHGYGSDGLCGRKAAFHDTDTDTDIIARRILARKSCVSDVRM